MARDCEVLSPAAQVIFEKLKPFFPLDPWGEPRWWTDGRIRDNWYYDLRKAADRQRLEEWYQKMIGSAFASEASRYREEHKTLEGFETAPRSRTTVNWAMLFLILWDLDFQIETGDVCGE